LAAIEPDVVRTEAGRKTRRIEQLGIEAADLHPQRPRLVVPVERHEAVELLERRRAAFDRGRRAGGRLARAAGGRLRAQQAAGQQRAES